MGMEEEGSEVEKEFVCKIYLRPTKTTDIE